MSVEVMEIVVGENKALEFKLIFDTIRELPIEETNILINKDGLSLQTMDSTHVSVVTLHIDRPYFSRYHCQKSVTLGINLMILTKLLKSVTKLDTITLATTKTEEHLQLTIKNKVREQLFYIPLFDLNLEHLKIPTIDYSLIYSVNSQEFSRMLQDISLVEGKDMTLKMGNKTLTLVSKGDLGKTTISMPGEKLEMSGQKTEPICWLVKDIETDTIEANFNLDFLRNIAKAKQFTKHNAIISLAKNFPLAINYPFDTGCHLLLHLAPKLEDEMDN